MAEYISVEADIEEVIKALDSTNKGLKSIQKQTIGIIAKGTVKAIKTVIKSSVNNHTNELINAYRYKVKKDGSEGNVYPKALNNDSTIYPKAMTLSYGHSGPTKTSKNWYIKPRGFVQAGKLYVESGGYNAEVEKMIDKQLKKYWGV